MLEHSQFDSGTLDQTASLDDVEGIELGLLAV